MAFEKPAPRAAATTSEVNLHVGTHLEGGVPTSHGYIERSVLDASGDEMARQRHPLTLLTQTERNQLTAILTRLRTLSDQNIAS